MSHAEKLTDSSTYRRFTRLVYVTAHCLLTIKPTTKQIDRFIRAESLDPMGVNPESHAHVFVTCPFLNLERTFTARNETGAEIVP